MKPIHRGLAALCACAAISSCASLTFALTPVRVLGAVERPAALCLGSVAVERATSGRSIEREIRRLAPLIFARSGHPLLTAGTEAGLSVDILVVEREFSSGTQDTRSLMVEAAIAHAGPQGPLPVLAARQTLIGSATAASSEDIYLSLERVIGGLLSAAYPGEGARKPGAAPAKTPAAEESSVPAAAEGGGS